MNIGLAISDEITPYTCFYFGGRVFFLNTEKANNFFLSEPRKSRVQRLASGH
jgi:hypothetical protein